MKELTTQQQALIEEAGKRLTFACIASSFAKKGKNGKKMTSYDPRIMDEFFKTQRINKSYGRKKDEIKKAIALIDKAKNSDHALYNVVKEKDQNGVGCWSYKFLLDINKKFVLFEFHIPRTENLPKNLNNYQKINAVCDVTGNKDAIETVSNYENTYKSTLSTLELYA